MTMPDPVRIGVIGCGAVAQGKHLPALMSLPGAVVHAIADIDLVKLAHVGERFGIANRHTDARALLEDSAVDMVAVCLPVEAHTEWAMAALDAGKHVFIEKPLAPNLADCDRIVDSAANANRRVMVGLQLRWHPLIRRAEAACIQGVLGDPFAIHTRFTDSVHRTLSPDPAEHDRLMLLDHGVHHFDLWRFLMKREVTQVYTVSTPGSIIVTATFDEGGTATAYFCDHTTNSQRIDLYGDRGQLSLNAYRFDGYKFTPTYAATGGMRFWVGEVAHFAAALPEGVRVLPKGGHFTLSYRYEWAHFLACIREDRPPSASVEDGRRAVEIALAAAESLASGAPIQMSHFRQLAALI